MKKHYTFLLISLFSFPLLFAQFTVQQHDGTIINDGDVFEFSETGTSADLTLVVINDATSSSTITLEYINMLNGDGSGENLCIFGLCYAPGAPNVGDSWDKVLSPGESTFDNADHFYNSDPGDGTNYPIDYVFRFTDSMGSDPIEFTYRYDPNISVNEIQEVDFELYPTIVESTINISVNEPVELQFFDIKGLLVASNFANHDIHEIDLSGLPAQVYFVLIKNMQGKRSFSKIIKK